MSNVNIKRAVENIKSSTTVFTPIVELVVNAIQAIEAKGIDDGVIEIKAIRSEQQELDDGLRDIVKFEVTDNGIGFTDENRDSFDTLYSDYKIDKGGKGFGRFICLKYFKELKIESVYQNSEGAFFRRTFEMGNAHEIVANEKIEQIEASKSFSRITLGRTKDRVVVPKKLKTIAKNLVEILLPYFITSDYKCPKIILREANDEDSRIILNDYLNSSSAVIEEVPLEQSMFVIEPQEDYKFDLRLFKIFHPKNKVSKVSLVADKREVVETSIHSYIPEFEDEFYENQGNNGDSQPRNYILKAYVFGSYLDENVSLERGDFEFNYDSDLKISQKEIEKKASEITKSAVSDEISLRIEKKIKHIRNYIDEEAPWHRRLIKDIDFSSLPYNATPEVIESSLQKEKYLREVKITREVKAVLEDKTKDFLSNVQDIVAQISEASRSDLIHYVAMRRKVIDMFKESLGYVSDERYEAEKILHEIIFPVKTDSDTVDFEDHNLWIIDERLNFTNYLSSDKPLNGPHTERPDILAFGSRVAFRGDNEASNPVTIFEFKRPGRDDFINPSSTEDPIKQIIRYVNSIRAGKFKTPEGREMQIGETTPFYGYVVCEMNAKIRKWLEEEKDFKPMPDGMGWFDWRENINLYIEVISWDKLLKDATLRNKVFFHKLGIE